MHKEWISCKRMIVVLFMLQVMLDPMGDGKDFRTCMQQSVSLPTGYYFGVSAASHNPAGKDWMIMALCIEYLLGNYR